MTPCGGHGLVSLEHPKCPVADERGSRLIPLNLLWMKLSDAWPGLVVSRVVATYLACRREVAAQVGADSRHGRSGQGKLGRAVVPSPLAGGPRRCVDADSETVGDSVDEADPLVPRLGCRPLRPSGATDHLKDRHRPGLRPQRPRITDASLHVLTVIGG
jgi:hypothetical protein